MIYHASIIKKIMEGKNHFYLVVEFWKYTGETHVGAVGHKSKEPNASILYMSLLQWCNYSLARAA